eukprot:gene7893-16156_t
MSIDNVGNGEDDDFESLLKNTRELAEDNRREINKQTKFGKIKRGLEFISTLDEVILELETANYRILEKAKFDESISHDVQVVYRYLDDVKKSLIKSKHIWLIFSRTPLEIEVYNHRYSLHDAIQQLMIKVNKPNIIIPEEVIEIRPPSPIKSPIKVEMKVEPKIEMEVHSLDEAYANLYGIGIPKNYNKSFQEFLRIANYENGEAMMMVASCYENGYGTERNMTLCHQWLEQGVLANYSGAKNELAMILIAESQASTNDKHPDSYSTSSTTTITTTRNRRDNNGMINTPALSTTGGGGSLLTEAQRKRHQTASMNNNNEEESTELGNGDNNDLNGDDDRSSRNHAVRTTTTTNNVAAAASVIMQRAIRLLLEASEEGHAEAQCNLGMLFEETRQFAEALQWYERAVSGGSVTAMNHIALLHFNGNTTASASSSSAVIVPKDHRRAFELFSLASLGGCISATYNEGVCLEEGYGVLPDQNRAIKAYGKAARLGNVRSMYNLGYLLVRRALENAPPVPPNGTSATPSNTSVPWLDVEHNRVYKKNCSGDGVGVGVCDKSLDVTGDLREGIRWLRSAADGGVPEAGYQLGRLYELGRGVAEDGAVAYALYLRAAEKGHGKAALCAANILYRGCNVVGEASFDAFIDGRKERESRKRAVMLYRQASLSGIPEAMNALALLLEELTDPNTFGEFVEASVRENMLFEASAWYFTAAEMGIIEAACNLALLICRPENIFIQVRTVDAVLGRADTMKELQHWLYNAIARKHPQSVLFQSALEQLQTIQ